MQKNQAQKQSLVYTRFTDLNKGTKAIQWEKGQSFQQMVLEKPDIHVQKMKLDPYHIPYTKISSKLTKDLNARAEIYKTLRRKWGKLHGTDFGKDFLDMTKSPATTTKR